MANLSDSLKNSLLSIARSREDAVELQTTLEQARTIEAGTNVTITDDGETVTINASGGGAPSGTANTLAFFDAAGDLSSNVEITLDESLKTLSILQTVGTNTVDHTGLASVILGYVEDSSITAGAAAALVRGVSQSGGALVADRVGTSVNGIASDAGSSINASSTGAEASGLVASAGSITASGAGAKAFGSVADGTLTAAGTGSMAFGGVSGVGAVIEATSTGTIAKGIASNGGIIRADTQGALAQGFADGVGQILATSSGAYAAGSTSTGVIEASGDGSIALSNTEASARGDASIAMGNFVIARSFASLVLGQYNVNNVLWSPVTWVADEPAIIVGGGTSDITRKNVFQVDKDGKVTETAAKNETAIRLITLNNVGVDTDNISARTDRTLVLDTTTAGGILVFPAPEDGLIYEITTSGNGVTQYDLDFATNGATTEGNVPTSITTQEYHVIKCFSGVWYKIG